MTQETVIALARDALSLALMLAAPTLGLSLLVGLTIAVLQATTQVQEQTLAFVPKIIAVLVSLLIFGSWMLSIITSFATNIFGNLSNIVR